MIDISEKYIFEILTAYYYNIEFQMGGLSYTQQLIILHSGDKWDYYARINQIVCDEILHFIFERFLPGTMKLYIIHVLYGDFNNTAWQIAYVVKNYQ